MKAIEQNIEKEIAQAVMEEQPMQPPAPKRKKRLTESTAAKVIAFLLMLVMTAVTAGGVLGAVFLYSFQAGAVFQYRLGRRADASQFPDLEQ